MKHNEQMSHDHQSVLIHELGNVHESYKAISLSLLELEKQHKETVHKLAFAENTIRFLEAHCESLEYVLKLYHNWASRMPPCEDAVLEETRLRLEERFHELLGEAH